MARLWQSGFEMNSLTAGVEFTTVNGGILPTISTTTVRTGTYAMHANPSLDDQWVTKTMYAANQNIVGYQRIYVRVATFPGGSDKPRVLQFSTAAGALLSYVVVNQFKKLDLYDNTLTKVGTVSSPAMVANTWYMVELMQDSSVSPAAISARFNGTQFASGFNTTQSPWGGIACGAFGGVPTCDFYLDDWALNDSTGTAQNSWPGEGGIVHLMPSATGDSNQWNTTTNIPGTASSWQVLQRASDAPPDDAVSLVQSGTVGNIDMYNVLPPSGMKADDTVNAVLVGARFANNVADATTAFRVRAEKTAGGTVAESASIIPNSTTWVTNNKAGTGGIWPLALPLDPDGNPWTKATLDTMQVGLNLTVAGTNRIQVTTMWASVDSVTLPPGKVVGKTQAVKRAAFY